MQESIVFTVNGIETFLFVEGEGAPVVLVHGMTASAESWLYTFDALRTNYRVFAPDLPGHGRSAGGRYPYCLDFYTRWLDALLDALDLEKIALFGHSMGGAVCLAYTLAHPARVERLMVADALGISSSLPMRTAWRTVTKFPHLLLATITGRDDPHLFRYTQGRTLNDPWGVARPALEGMLSAGRTYPRPLWGAWPGFRLILADYFMPRKRRCFIDRQASITVPTLIAWGADDGLLPVAHAYEGRDRIPDAMLCIFERSNHAPMMEEPEAFNAAMRAFLDGTNPKSL
jgi:pimeloyl-ACP methyl ester carboxylesterase